MDRESVTPERHTDETGDMQSAENPFIGAAKSFPFMNGTPPPGTPSRQGEEQSPAPFDLSIDTLAHLNPTEFSPMPTASPSAVERQRKWEEIEESRCQRYFEDRGYREKVFKNMHRGLFEKQMFSPHAYNPVVICGPTVRNRNPMRFSPDSKSDTPTRQPPHILEDEEEGVVEESHNDLEQDEMNSTLELTFDGEMDGDDLHYDLDNSFQSIDDLNEQDSEEFLEGMQMDLALEGGDGSNGGGEICMAELYDMLHDNNLAPVTEDGDDEEVTQSASNIDMMSGIQEANTTNFSFTQEVERTATSMKEDHTAALSSLREDTTLGTTAEAVSAHEDDKENWQPMYVSSVTNPHSDVSSIRGCSRLPTMRSTPTQTPPAREESSYTRGTSALYSRLNLNHKSSPILDGSSVRLSPSVHVPQLELSSFKHYKQFKEKFASSPEELRSARKFGVDLRNRSLSS